METLLQVGLSNAAVVAVMALVLLPAARLLRRPALTHALCLLILLKLVTPPVWHVPVGWLAPAGASSHSDAANVSKPVGLARGSWGGGAAVATVAGAHDRSVEPEPRRSPAAIGGAAPAPARASATRVIEGARSRLARPGASFDWRALLPWAWLAGSALCLASIAFRVRLLRRLLRFAEPAPPGVQRRAAALAGRFGLDAAPGVWLAPGCVPPMLLGLPPRARLYVSAKLWAGLAERQRDALLLHELAHFRRRDHWVRPLELLVTALYWWHPAVWLTRRAMREAEEQCCDAWAVWGMPAGTSARDYAAALLDVVDFASRARRGSAAVPVLASGMGEFRHLKRRLTMIQRSSIPRTLTWSGVAAVCALGALLLPLGPMAAQTSDPAPTGDAEQADARTQPPEADGAKGGAGDAEAPRQNRPGNPADKDTFQLHAKLVASELKLKQAERDVQQLEADAVAMQQFRQRIASAGGGERVVEVVAVSNLGAEDAERAFRVLGQLAEVTVTADLRNNALILRGPRGRVDFMKEEMARFERGLVGVAGPTEPPPPPGPALPGDRARELRLLDVASFKDGIDTRGRAVRFAGKDGEVVITPGDETLVELPKATTELEWSAGDSTERVGTAADGPPFDYVLCAWDKNGKLTWTLYSSPRLAWPEDAKRRAEAQLAAVEKRLAELEARRRAFDDKPAPGDDDVLITHDAGQLRAVDGKSGKLMWTSELAGEPLFPPAVSKGRVYVGVAGDKLLVFDLQTGKRLPDRAGAGRN